MKNLSITIKFFFILGVLSIFLLSSIFYSAIQVNMIKDGYVGVANGSSAAASLLASANRELITSRADIGQLLIETTDAGNQKALRAVNKDHAAFDDFMDQVLWRNIA